MYRGAVIQISKGPFGIRVQGLGLRLPLEGSAIEFTATDLESNKIDLTVATLLESEPGEKARIRFMPLG